MALWHLYRIDVGPQAGSLELVCDAGEHAAKLTLYDSDEQVYSELTACVADGATEPDILHQLSLAGYTPNDWDA